MFKIEGPLELKLMLGTLYVLGLISMLIGLFIAIFMFRIGVVLMRFTVGFVIVMVKILRYCYL